MMCRCGNCPYANDHIDFSTTDTIRCNITGDIHHSKDVCDCLDQSHIDDFEYHKSLFSTFKRKVVDH
jgi:hypothetical protein